MKRKFIVLIAPAAMIYLRLSYVMNANLEQIII
jgi:hypothetical protein